MASIDDVNGIDRFITYSGAEENEISCSLYTNESIHHGSCYSDENILKKTEPIVQGFPLIQTMINIHAQYFNDVLNQQISQGYRQIVILRTDSNRRIVREPAEGNNYFEIGQDTGLQERHLNSSNTIANVTYVAGDYLKDDFIHLLSKHHFDCDVPTYFIWEGTTASLKRGSIILILEKIRNQVKHFKLSLGYLSHTVIARTTGDPELDQYMDDLEKMDIHWITGFKDMATFARALGFKMVETVSIADLYARYYSTDSLPSKIFRFHFVCTLECGE